jgi:hypothetical protein
VIAADAYFPNDQTSNGEAKGIQDQDKIEMMKARSNDRAANRGNRLARAALMCGPGSKICPPDRATELLEAIIEPGDRVVIEGDNQKQADFLAAAHAKADPARLHDLEQSRVPRASMRCWPPSISRRRIQGSRKPRNNRRV